MVDVTDSIRVLLVDDDAMVRTALRMILGGDSRIEVVGEAADGEEGVALAATLRPDIVLLDVRMPRRDGLSAATAMLAAERAPRIIILTTFDADDLVLQALAVGAQGFLLKDTPPQQVVAAVHAVAAGQPILSPSATAAVIASAVSRPATAAPAEVSRRERAKAALAELTDRERDVAAAIGRGDSNAEIAAALYLSVPTVKAHVGRIFSKLGTDNRIRVALLVNEAGPVDPE